ncbi:hypothetical protein BDD12DRAFT_800908 [Trichophaea hybrida]|nr:hypothetical protein BDD12DRAFT_800908 [Trichophaea hybrida]
MGKERPNSKSLPKETKKKGFSVGPANLPDGVYKRKVTKIKETLIHKAKVRKQYSKVLSSVDPSTDPNVLRAQKLFEEAEQERLLRRAKTIESEAAEGEAEPPGVHPDRQAILDREGTPEKSQAERRKRKPKTSSYKKEESFAAKQKKEREEAARQVAARRKEQEQKTREREMRKRAMSAKTRDGQVKLGKTSHILLEKIMAQVGQK